MKYEESIDDLRHHIGIVFQNPDNQFVGVTVKDDIAFGLENRNIEPHPILTEDYENVSNPSVKEIVDTRIKVA